ncbi:MAG: hypothetical protein HY017_05405 [Betaproteobacteria bacterium]|nr:hypothetical protein [Betaproteobacteria bacterium]
MRRGLMAWSQQEIPAGVLEKRVAALVAGMRARGLACVLAYTDLTRPAAVSALTHFIPYWSNGVLVVSPSAGATLVVTLSGRVAEWIRSTSRLDDLVNTLDLGTGVAERISTTEKGAIRVGIVELSSFPSSVVAAIRKLHPAIEFEDATDLLNAALAQEGLRTDVVAARTIAIARVALAAGAAEAGGRDANAVVAAAEGTARREGAEEILLAVAPDAVADPRLRRIEGAALLGDAFALQVSVAYKGCWLRIGRTLSSGALPPWIAETDAWFERLVSEIATGAPPNVAIPTALTRLPGATLDSWRAETARAGLALAVVAGSAPFSSERPLPVAPITLTLRLRRGKGWWFSAAPFVFARARSPA